MGLVVNTNSYVSVAEADDYFSDRLNASDWITYTQKEQALITATTLLDSLCTWYGDKSSDSQALAFPRDGEVSVPDDIKVAQLEITLELMSQSESSFTETSEVLKQLKAGSVSMEFFDRSFVIPVVNSVARSILSKYGSCNFGGSGISVVSVSR